LLFWELANLNYLYGDFLGVLVLLKHDKKICTSGETFVRTFFI